MNLYKTRIATGGAFRLRKAVKDQVRHKFQPELAAAKTWTERAAVQRKIKDAIDAELKRISSPQSLW
jgi:acyl-CoA reductase-like NAD-dependent aldehyde dehydrogenase